MQSAPPSATTRPNRRPDAAFTILEVAMSSFVMAFGIATSIIAMQTGFKSIDLARGTELEQPRAVLAIWAAAAAR